MTREAWKLLQSKKYSKNGYSKGYAIDHHVIDYDKVERISGPYIETNIMYIEIFFTSGKLKKIYRTLPRKIKSVKKLFGFRDILLSPEEYWESMETDKEIKDHYDILNGVSDSFREYIIRKKRIETKEKK